MAQHSALYTEESERIPDVPWDVHPRPQMMRKNWVNLNGEWEFAIKPGAEFPAEYPAGIRVPFPPESALSGVQKSPEKGEFLFYRKKVALEMPAARRILHVDGADQVAEVFVNGVAYPAHEGGYEPFCLDVTDAWREETEICIRIRDDLDNTLPYGKQTKKPGGMWYTPVSGIWQTVWLEDMPENAMESVRFTPDLTGVSIEIAGGGGAYACEIELPGGVLRAEWTGAVHRVEIPDPVLWSPEHPHLYPVRISSGEDAVESYFALRTLTVEEKNGLPRLCLNGKPYFFHGLLDQGYFPDGLFLPASPEGYERDILAAKKLGYNMLRKHIKREPEAFYAACDRLGMVVFQDCVNNGQYSFLRDTALPTVGLKKLPGFLAPRRKKTKQAFYRTAESLVRGLYNHPSVCYWTIFNEGWGQFDPDGAYDAVRGWDGTRFIDTTSGWFYGKKTDVTSLHVYFRPVKLRPGKKPVVLSEFGGYSCRIPGHSWAEKVYGYRKYENTADLQAGILALYREEIVPAVRQGLCADVLTQITDVEEETNGLLTYDRRVVKPEPAPMCEIAQMLKDEIER